MRVRELLTIIGGRPLLPDPLPHDPMPILKAWLDEAMAAKDRPNPNSVVLATATPDGVPSARVILCKGLEVETGSALFFTNYDSKN